MSGSREEGGDEFLFEQNLGELKVEGHDSFQVIGLYVDATKLEERVYNAKDGHVIQLQAECGVVRESRASQTHTYGNSLPPASVFVS